MDNKKDYADKICPKKCKNCDFRKVMTHSVIPYNFCTKLNVSFSKGDPDSFLNCSK